MASYCLASKKSRKIIISANKKNIYPTIKLGFLGISRNVERYGPKPCLPRKNPSMDFFWDCRIAEHFCMLLSRHPWLHIAWQARKVEKSLSLPTKKTFIQQ